MGTGPNFSNLSTSSVVEQGQQPSESGTNESLGVGGQQRSEAQISNRTVSSNEDPSNEPGRPGLSIASAPPAPTPQAPIVQSRDLMAENREKDIAWNGVKRDLSKWAAQNEGKSMTKGDVTVSSSTKNSSGADARPGYHYMTLKQGATTIELLVHDASGDIARDAMTVNGVKVKDFSVEVADTFGKLKGMINAMKTPVAPESQNTSNNNQSTQQGRDKLIKMLDDEQFMTGFLTQVRDNKLEVLADIASKVSKDSTPEQKVLASTIMTFARELHGSQRFNQNGQSNFSKLGSDVEDVAKKFSELTPEERKNYFSKWLNAMDDYLRVTADGQIVVEDDKGKQYLIDEGGSVIPAPKKLQGLQKIPDNENGRVASFLIVRAMLTGRYNPTEMLGFTTQDR